MSLIIEQGLSFWIGLFLAVVSLSLLLHTGRWVQLMADYGGMPSSMLLVISCANLSLGAFILGFHWKWEGWAAALTLLGLLATIKGMLYLLFPGFLSSIIDRIVAQRPNSLQMQLRLGGVVQLAVSLAILYNWWLL